MIRAQSSFEAISLFAAASLILTTFMIYFGAQISTHAEQREFDSLQDLASTIRQEISLARQAGPGYERTFIIPGSAGMKGLIFTLEYPDGPGASEITVRFEPPIAETIVASDVLGEGVYGLFSGGTNTIRVYRGGIVVEPDETYADEMVDDMLAAGIDPPQAEIAFAHISSDTVRLSETIECEYAASNRWIRPGGSTGGPGGSREWVDIAWLVSDAHGNTGCYGDILGDGYGERAVLDVSEASDVIDLVRGSNLSCAAQYGTVEDPPPRSESAICNDIGSSQSSERIAFSRNATIVNSRPAIEVDPLETVTGVDTGTTTVWDFNLRFSIRDADPGDDEFNASIVFDGTNAQHLECDPCSWSADSAIEEGTDVSVDLTLEVPWPADGGCADVNRLSFVISAIESNGASELYTLERVDVSDALEC